jgi:hypothetical protein
METLELEQLRYPVGKFATPEDYSDADIKKWISSLEEFPNQLRSEVSDFTEEMLGTSYKPGGWTARQVVHHVADSHTNAYMRFKLALTEDNPIIKPYDQNLWAELPEAKTAMCEISLDLLDALHRRLVIMLRKMTPADFERKFTNPETKKEFTLKTALALYSWHGQHHLGHIRIVKRKFATVK